MERIVVFVDERPCGLAALRHAIPLAAPGTLLDVVLPAPKVSWWITIAWSQGLTLPDPREEAVADLFDRAAALIAPTGLAWDFSVRSRPAPGAGGAGLALTVRHRAAYPHPHRLVSRSRATRFAHTEHDAGLALVVACDHGRDPATGRAEAADRLR